MKEGRLQCKDCLLLGVKEPCAECADGVGWKCPKWPGHVHPEMGACKHARSAILTKDEVDIVVKWSALVEARPDYVIPKDEKALELKAIEWMG